MIPRCPRQLSVCIMDEFDCEINYDLRDPSSIRTDIRPHEVTSAFSENLEFLQ